MKIKTGIIGAFKSVVGNENSHRFTSAVILAGGVGARMGNSETTKQLLEVCGMPVVARTLAAFENCSIIDEIIVVARKEEYPEYRKMIKQYGFKKIKKITNGGETRFDSALHGFVKIDERSEFVAIHDAARCLITPSLIEKTANEAYKIGAAAPCHKISDTFKTVNENDLVLSTIKRDTLRAVETPQIFKTELYRAAAYIAKQKKLAVTDDCSLVENIGYAVKLVESDGTNIKITEPKDIALAEILLSGRNDNGENLQCAE